MPIGRAATKRWLAFVVVSTVWMPALFTYLLSNSHYARTVDIAGLPLVIAHLTLNGLPLALPCILIRATGRPLTAWAMLGLVGTITAVWLVIVMAASQSGRTGPVEVYMLASGSHAAIISLPAWLILGAIWLRQRPAGRNSDDRT